MKALIVDIEGKYAIAMTKEGTFMKVKNNGKFTVGYEAELPPRILANIKSMASAASVAILLLAVGLSFFLYNNPYSYINIDINPSVQITANIFDRIINVTALNIDAQKIVNELSIENKELDQGVEQIVGSAVKNGYLKDEKTNAVMLTVTSIGDRKSEKLQKKVAVAVEKKFKSEKVTSEVLVEKATEKSRSQAIKQGISPGKLKLVQKLIELNPNLKVNELKNKPVKEILESIRESTKSQKPSKPNNSNSKESGKNSGKINSSSKSVSTPKNTVTPLPLKEKQKGKDKKDSYKGNSSKDNASKEKSGRTKPGSSPKDNTDKPEKNNSKDQSKNDRIMEKEGNKVKPSRQNNNTHKSYNGNLKEKTKSDASADKDKEILI
jgi:hypothetical protein